MFDFAEVNWLAVLVAGVASFILGGMWYAALFSKPWMRYTGITAESASAGGSAAMALHYLGAFLTYLVAVAVLALVMQSAGVAGAGPGLLFGFVVGAGIVGTVSFNTYMFSRKPIGLYLIDVGYPVAALTLAGLILGAWQ